MAQTGLDRQAPTADLDRARQAQTKFAALLDRNQVRIERTIDPQHLRVKVDALDPAQCLPAQRAARAKLLRARQLDQRRAERATHARFEIVTAAAGAGQAVIAQPGRGPFVEPALYSHTPAQPGLGGIAGRTQPNQIAALIDNSAPVPSLARRQAFNPDVLAGPFAADLALRAIEHDFEVVLTKLQLDIREFIAAIAAIGLIGPQRAVAIEFSVPTVWQRSAQRGQPKPRGQVERAIRNERAAAITALCGECAGGGIDITQRNLRRTKRPQHLSCRIVAIKLQSQRIRRDTVASRNPRGIAHSNDFAAGERFVLRSDPAAAAPLALNLDIDRGRAPGLVGRIGLRQAGEVKLTVGRPLKSCRATFALDRFQKRQFAVAFDHHGQIADVRPELHPQPLRQRGQAHAPAFGRIKDRRCADRPVSVHGLYCI